MTARIFVPCDAAALSMGAEAVAHAVKAEIANRKLDAVLVRNGSRGLMWLEPLVEVETPAGRVGYGPVNASDVAAIFDAGLGKAHPLNLGIVDAIPYLAKQQRLTFARCGITDPLSLADYEAHGGLKGLKRALEMAPLQGTEDKRNGRAGAQGLGQRSPVENNPPAGDQVRGDGPGKEVPVGKTLDRITGCKG